MTTESLEQECEDFVIKRCSQCGNELRIPKSFHEKEDGNIKNIDFSRSRQYPGFFLSPCGYYYYNSHCYVHRRLKF